MSKDEKNKDLKAQLWGWVLFVICAVLFTGSAVRAKDVLATAGSIVFLLGCAVFMVPLVRAITHGDPPE
jgi:hypothetical protein